MTSYDATMYVGCLFAGAFMIGAFYLARRHAQLEAIVDAQEAAAEEELRAAIEAAVNGDMAADAAQPDGKPQQRATIVGTVDLRNPVYVVLPGQAAERRSGSVWVAHRVSARPDAKIRSAARQS